MPQNLKASQVDGLVKLALRAVPCATFEDTMFPGNQRERILAAEACALQGLLANAGEAVVTYTTMLPVNNADMLGLLTARLRLKNGERVAVLGRSVCLG